MTKANILLVEDSKTQGAETKKFLEKCGYNVTWAQDGMSVFKVATAQAIDVVLLDRVLPDMDGSQICRWFKLNQETKGIPIIMITAKSTTMDKVQGLESGADDYLPKPYEEIELNARVYAALRTKTLRDELKHANQELKEMLTRVEIMSITDPMTGLFNRRRFEPLLDLEFKKATRYSVSLSCMMIDIDNFKVVNDNYGHAVGDVVIKDVSLIIQQSIRDVDTACRWGGEEFVVLTPFTNKMNAVIPAQKILHSLLDHTFAGLGGKKVTVSIGIADVSAPDIDTAEKLVNAADIAMYEAKRKGRNRIEIK
ncbi:MAG TPA: diguanylate cyclase [Nitrospirota bacterium]|nr:diguanylate cyclase [Nitrospirota bacterium]